MDWERRQRLRELRRQSALSPHEPSSRATRATCDGAQVVARQCGGVGGGETARRATSPDERFVNDIGPAAAIEADARLFQTRQRERSRDASARVVTHAGNPLHPSNPYRGSSEQPARAALRPPSSAFLRPHPCRSASQWPRCEPELRPRRTAREASPSGSRDRRAEADPRFPTSDPRSITLPPIATPAAPPAAPGRGSRAPRRPGARRRGRSS